MTTSRLPTLHDVARRAGVSVATASRVLNGSLRRVSPDLHERVLTAAGELGYTANAQAQALARATTSLVGLLLNDVADPYFAGIASGVLTAAAGHDARVVIANTGADPHTAAGHLAALRGQRARAAVLVGSRVADATAERRMIDEIGRLTGTGGRVVAVSQPGLPADTVSPDNHGGARALAAYLLGKGHTRFAAVAGPYQLQTVQERLAGFRAGGVDLPDSAVIEAEFSRDGGYRAGLALPEGPTAVFVTSDVMATGFCTALRERGIRIPADVAVAGFDDLPVVRDLYPPLTTVRLPLPQMGERAFTLAMQPADPRRHRLVTVPAELVIRASA